MVVVLGSFELVNIAYYILLPWDKIGTTDAVAVAAVHRLDGMSRHRKWFSQASDRVGTVGIRWHLRQLRTHLRVVWRMTYPPPALAGGGSSAPQAPKTDDPVPPTLGVTAPMDHNDRSTGDVAPDLRPDAELGIAGGDYHGSSNDDHGIDQDHDDDAVAECLPIFLCALGIVRHMIDKLPWEHSNLRNIPVESDELHLIMQIVQEVLTPQSAHSPPP